MKYEKIALSIVLVSLPCLVFGAILPVYTKNQGYSVFQLTLLFSVFSCSELFMRVFIGKISDRYSRYVILCVSVLLYGLAYLMLSGAQNLIYLMIARMIQGAAGILLTISAVSFITAEHGNFASGFGRYSRSRNLGGLIGIGLAFYLFSRSQFLEGWKNLFVISAVSCLASFIFMVSRKKDLVAQPVIPSQKVVYTRLEQKIWLLNMLYCIVSSLAGVLIIPYMMAVYDVDMGVIGLVFLLPVFLSSYFSPRIGRIGDRVGYRKTIFFSTVLAAVFILFLTFRMDLKVFAIIWTLYELSLSAQDYSLDGLFVKEIPKDRIGNFYGKYMLGTSLGGIVGPFFGGVLYQMLGRTAPYVACSIFLLLLTLLAFLLLPEEN